VPTGTNFSLGLGIFLTGAAYGGLHLLAWNGPFVNPSEQILWRISSFVLVGAIVMPPYLLVMGFLIISMKGAECAQGVQSTLIRPFYASLLVVSLVYVAARLYLVVECFINLAHLPDEVFKQPEWSVYIPHFGAG
jgi:hypothetical protein